MCSVASTTCCSRAAVIWRLRPRPGASWVNTSGPRRRTGGATRAPYPGSCRAVERCTCSAGRQRRATRCGSATPRAAPWCRLEASVPASRGALASVAKRGLGSCRARYQSPVGSTRRLAITALAACPFVSSHCTKCGWSLAKPERPLRPPRQKFFLPEPWYPNCGIALGPPSASLATPMATGESPSGWSSMRTTCEDRVRCRKDNDLTGPSV